jgi:penicillin-insensitive murein endopeptidase
MRSVRRLALAPLLLAGCTGPFLLTDGTSVSGGSFNHGWLRHGRALPTEGEGYLIPDLWKERDARYGTDEMVRAIARAAKRVHREYPGGTLGIGDLSLKGGGDSEHHRSHENGRDADLIFYAVDEADKPVLPANSMPRYGADLRARPPAPDPTIQYGPFSPRRFDVKRNWALVRALLEDPHIEVQFLFCHVDLRQKLLDWARSIGEDPGLMDRAAALLHQPGDSLPHDDHLHLRIFCASDDRALGCVDRGPVRWWKKRYKYMAPSRREDLDDVLSRIALAPFLAIPRFIP